MKNHYINFLIFYFLFLLIFYDAIGRFLMVFHWPYDFLEISNGLIFQLSFIIRLLLIFISIFFFIKRAELQNEILRMLLITTLIIIIIENVITLIIFTLLELKSNDLI